MTNAPERARRKVWSALSKLVPATRGVLGQHRGGVVFLVDLTTIVVSLVAAFLLRFEFKVPVTERTLLFQGLGIALTSKLLVFRALGLERRSWRFASLSDLAGITRANVIGSVVFTMLTGVLVGRAFPRSIYLLDLLLCFLATAGTRFLVRFLWESSSTRATGSPSKRVLIYGAGTAGVMLRKHLRASSVADAEVVGFLDDDPHKRGATFDDASVLGTGEEATEIVSRHRIDEIWVALPSAGKQQKERIRRVCRSANVAQRTIPDLAEVLTRLGGSETAWEAFPRRLMDREPVTFENPTVKEYVEGQSIMVTGAGGSIGAELCRQLAEYRPRRLVAFERSERDLFYIERALKDAFPETEIVPELGDVVEMESTRESIRRHDVTTILHAAAYKHVPMMESQVLQAIRNNVLGCLNLVTLAREQAVGRFVLISSDKAVNPTSVMGATKRLSELIVSSASANSTICLAVRFGNVLGSSASVLPLFQEQIAAGGPVTVTHPEMLRYFLTSREAVQLVIHAAAMGKGGEIFVLDMGNPVKIVELAERLIRASGMKPYEDIPIVFTGCRAGEKVREELVSGVERLEKTEHDNIRVVRGPRKQPEEIQQCMSQLTSLVERHDASGAMAKLQEMVPEYSPSVFARQHASEQSRQHPAAVRSTEEGGSNDERSRSVQ